MATAEQIKALVKHFIEEDEQRFVTVALQVADKEAKKGHTRLAEDLRRLVHSKRSSPNRRVTTGLGLTTVSKRSSRQNNVDLDSLLHLSQADTRMNEVVLNDRCQAGIERVIMEHRQKDKLARYALSPRRKILLCGPPGTGKTLTAKVLATELKLPLYTLQFDGLISRYLGETAGKLRAVFDQIARSRAVYLFDEFDAIGAHRNSTNDVGEVRRVLNSFLKFFEDDSSESLIVCATNHPELLDKALFRRFDDIIEFSKPSWSDAERFIKNRLFLFDLSRLELNPLKELVEGMSYADLGQACDDAAKSCIMNHDGKMDVPLLAEAINLRAR
ncbi:AAA family ATPase [Marinobacter shengliensis]